MIRSTLENERSRSKLGRTSPQRIVAATIDTISDEGSGVAQINFTGPVMINDRVVPQMVATTSAGSVLAESIAALDNQTAEVQFTTVSPLVSVRVDNGEPSVHTDTGGEIPPGTYPIT